MKKITTPNSTHIVSPSFANFASRQWFDVPSAGSGKRTNSTPVWSPADPPAICASQRWIRRRRRMPPSVGSAKSLDLGTLAAMKSVRIHDYFVCRQPVVASRRCSCFVSASNPLAVHRENSQSSTASKLKEGKKILAFHFTVVLNFSHGESGKWKLAPSRNWRKKPPMFIYNIFLLFGLETCLL